MQAAITAIECINFVEGIVPLSVGVGLFGLADYATTASLKSVPQGIMAWLRQYLALHPELKF
jgi:hypothetical protein